MADKSHVDKSLKKQGDKNTYFFDYSGDTGSIFNQNKQPSAHKQIRVQGCKNHRAGFYSEVLNLKI